MARFDYPNLGPADEASAGEYVVSLYQALGWDQKAELDPKRIVMNPQHWQDVCSALQKSEDSRSAGYFWMNYGPSADERVPYGKIEVEDGALGREVPGLSEADRRAIDEAVSYSFATEGGVAYLEADRGDGNEFLLQCAYDSRNMGPQGFLEALHDMVDESWEESIDLAVDEVLERSGILLSDERYDAARDYLLENYSFEPPYAHYLDQSMKVNVMLGTEAEANLDFGSIRAMCDGLGEPGDLEAEDMDNGLAWLVEQQGYGVDELRSAVSCYGERGFDACEAVHGTFLASVAEEMANFPNTMGAVAVLARMSMHDMAKTLDPHTSLVMPKGATVGLFAPWAGGGSTLGIQLERDLVIPSDARSDMQVEGAGCDGYTVNDVYGLVGDAWKRPLDITDPIRGYDVMAATDDLDAVLKEAKSRAAEKNLACLDIPKDLNRKPPEIGL